MIKYYFFELEVFEISLLKPKLDAQSKIYERLALDLQCKLAYNKTPDPQKKLAQWMEVCYQAASQNRCYGTTRHIAIYQFPNGEVPILV